METFKYSFFGLLVVLLLPLVVLGAIFQVANEDNPNISISERIQDDLYVAGGSISHTGTITGDLFATGGTILINGPIGEDLFAGGGTVTVIGNVGGDVRVAGGTLVLQGGIRGDALIGGGQITITGPQVSGDVLVGGGTIHIESPVQGDIRAGGGDVYINSFVGGNVEVNAERLHLGPKALINGTLSYTSPKEVVMDSGAQVKGAVSYEPREKVGSGKEAIATLASFWVFVKTLTLLLLSLLIGLFFKRYSVKAVESFTASPLLEFGRGLIVFIVLPVLSVILMFTLVGAPIGILGFVSIIALTIASFGFAPVILGSLLHKWAMKGSQYIVSWKTIVLGVLAYTVLCFIPLVGWLITAFLMFASVGVIINLKMKIAKEWR